MRVVVDASIVVAALIRPRGWTATELKRADVEWYVPGFLFDELREHLGEFAGLADCSPSTLRGRIEGLRSLHVIEGRTLIPFLDNPLVRRAEAIDVDDASYLVAVLAVGADYLWTRDKEILAAFPSLAVRIVPRSQP
jgi:predicted nucleic acid-binding protein